METFNQKHSIISKFTSLILITLSFYLLLIIAHYYSSRNFLNGLTNVNQANQLLNVANQILTSINSAGELLQKIEMKTDLSESEMNDVRSSFQVAYEQALSGLEKAKSIKLTGDISQITELLEDADEIIKRFGDAAAQTLSKQKGRLVSDMLVQTKREIMVVKQLELEISEILRKLQIQTKKDTDRFFEESYKIRHFPLIVGIALTLLAVAIVWLSGYSITRNFRRAINDLLKATTAVASGDVKYRAVIHAPDEIGKLANDFNHMVAKLNESMARNANLQSITASFSESLDPKQVAETVVNQAFSVVGAEAGSVSLISEDGISSETLASKGVEKEELYKQWDLEVLPLVIDGKTIGTMELGFKSRTLFNEEDKIYISSLTQLCAQAINRSRLYARAQSAIQLRDEFLSIASHELKTPLTSLNLQIGMFNHLVKNTADLNETRDRIATLMDVAKRQLTHLAELIERLLDVSRISTGKLALAPAPMDLVELTREVIERLTMTAKQAGCEITLKSDPKLSGNWDKSRIDQVITNLLTNAIKYAEKKPIDISVFREGVVAVLEVKDHGIGIAEDQVERIFEKFYRAASRNYAGIGLGLFIAKQIVESHGGMIFVASKLGVGTCFRVELPLS